MVFLKIAFEKLFKKNINEVQIYFFLHSCRMTRSLCSSHYLLIGRLHGHLYPGLQCALMCYERVCSTNHRVGLAKANGAQSPGGGHAALSHEITKPVQSADKFFALSYLDTSNSVHSRDFIHANRKITSQMGIYTLAVQSITTKTICQCI